MDGTRAQVLVNRGYALAAKRLGLPYAQHRPDGPADPVRPATLLRSLPVSFDANAYRYTQPQKPGQATWTGLWDAALTQPGDYLVGADKTYFVASQDHLLPLTAVLCNAVLTFARPTGPTGFGAVEGYGGDVRGEEGTLLTGWPCSLLTGARGESSSSDLPSEPRADSGFTVSLPVLPDGLSLQAGDYATDESGSRYVIAGAEQTHRGWRLKAVLTTV